MQEMQALPQGVHFQAPRHVAVSGTTWPTPAVHGTTGRVVGHPGSSLDMEGIQSMQSALRRSQSPISMTPGGVPVSRFSSRTLSPQTLPSNVTQLISSAKPTHSPELSPSAKCQVAETGVTGDGTIMAQLDSLMARFDQIMKMRPSGQELSKSSLTTQDVGLLQENAELLVQVQNHDALIAKLTKEVDNMQSQLESIKTDRKKVVLESPTNELQGQLRSALNSMRNMETEVHQIQVQVLESQKREREILEGRGSERMRFQKELQEIHSLLRSQQSPAAQPQGEDTNEIPIVAPFNRQVCGVNISLSDDSYIARRIRGCRQSVVIGGAPLSRNKHGWYYEVEIRETVAGWVGGLGIGVTRTDPESLGRAPDKAWRVPNTFIAGYSGCVFIDGKEQRTKWRADHLKVGSHVGLLVSGDGTGDIRVFVDGKPVMLINNAAPEPVGVDGFGYYPILDVFAATLSVQLRPLALVPPQPWILDMSHLSPPAMSRGSRSSGGNVSHAS